MKRALLVILTFIVILCLGCSKESKTISNPASYPLETAKKNGDVIRTNNGTVYNTEKLDEFIENVKKETKDKIRITQYTTSNKN